MWRGVDYHLFVNNTIKHLLVNEKGDVGMAKRFSKKYGNKG